MTIDDVYDKPSGNDAIGGLVVDHSGDDPEYRREVRQGVRGRCSGRAAVLQDGVGC
jgi:hypothetical protein